MWRYVSIEHDGKGFIQHVPKKWSNKRVKEELGDLIPIDKVKSVPKKNVKKKDRVD